MWNCDWEYQNQDIMKKNYDRQLSGQYKPVTPIRKIICEGCGCVFYTRIWSKKYCYYKKCGNIGHRKQLRQRRLAEPPRTQVCKMCGKVFTPKRSDALYVPLPMSASIFTPWKSRRWSAAAAKPWGKISAPTKST